MSRLQNSYLKASGNFDVALVKNIQDKESELLSLIRFDEDSSTESFKNPLSPKSVTYLGTASITSSPDLVLSNPRTDERSSKPVQSIIEEISRVNSSTNLDQNPDWTFELAAFKLECPSPWIYVVSNAHVKTIANRRSLAKDGIKVDVFFRNVQRK